MTIMTLYYTLLWVVMMIVGGLFYEQPYFSKKRGKKYETMAHVGWILIIAATVGLIHGILGFLHLIVM